MKEPMVVQAQFTVLVTKHGQSSELVVRFESDSWKVVKARPWDSPQVREVDEGRVKWAKDVGYLMAAQTART